MSTRNTGQIFKNEKHMSYKYAQCCILDNETLRNIINMYIVYMNIYKKYTYIYIYIYR